METDKQVRHYTRPTLIENGRQQYVSSGRWNDDCVCDYIVEHGSTRWIEVGELARLVWRLNSDTNRQKARRRLPALRRFMAIKRGLLLVVEYHDKYSAASHLKLYDESQESDRLAIDRVIDELAKRKDKLAEYYQHIRGLLPAPAVAGTTTANAPQDSSGSGSA